MQLEEQLLQTEKLTSLGLLAAGVAHEVNTPLAVISNYIQMLAKQLPANDPRHKLTEKIVKQTFRASEIVNNLLSFSRTGGTEFKEVHLDQVIEETLTLVAHPFRAANVQVIKTLDSDLPSILGSSNRLQQVFLNLFLNAKDAMPSGGMLEVRSSANNGSVEVEVTDTGLGIQREADGFGLAGDIGADVEMLGDDRGEGEAPSQCTGRLRRQRIGSRPSWPSSRARRARTRTPRRLLTRCRRTGNGGC